MGSRARTPPSRHTPALDHRRGGRLHCVDTLQDRPARFEPEQLFCYAQSRAHGHRPDLRTGKQGSRLTRGSIWSVADEISGSVQPQPLHHRAGGCLRHGAGGIEGGRKESHWMWFVFPQLRGLGSSPMSRFYGIGTLDEARAYLSHPLLGDRLVVCTRTVLAIRGRLARCDFRNPGPFEILLLHDPLCAGLWRWERLVRAGARPLLRRPEGRPHVGAHRGRNRIAKARMRRPLACQPHAWSSTGGVP